MSEPTLMGLHDLTKGTRIKVDGIVVIVRDVTNNDDGSVTIATSETLSP